MFRPMNALALVGCAAACLATAPRAQQDDQAIAFANCYVAMSAPAKDAPDAQAAEILSVTESLRTASFAAFLLQLVQDSRSLLQRPADLLPAVEQLIAHDDLHGAAHDKLLWLRHQLLRAAAPSADAAKHDPMAGLPRNFLCIGPFGEGEDCFAGVPFAPELAPFALDATFATKLRTLRVRPFAIDIGDSTVEPGDPARPGEGCYYALHRVEAAQDTQCYLRLWSRGGLEVFVNGAWISTTDPSLDNGRNDRAVPIALAKGTNHVLVKTTSSSNTSFEFSYVDARMSPVPGLREISVGDPIGPHAAALLPSLPPLGDGVRRLMRAIENTQGNDRTALQIATALVADSLGLRERQLQLIDDLQIEEPVQQLAAARLWRRLDLVPEELRNARARALEEGATKQLDKSHWGMLRASVGLLQQQDKPEQALQELWQAVDAKRAGPSTYRLLLSVAQRARFSQERHRIIASWRKALPSDPKAAIEQSKYLYRAGAAAQAAELGIAAIRMRPDLNSNLQHAYNPAIELGDTATAQAAVDLVMPKEMYLPGKRFTPLLWDIAIAHREADPTRWLELIDTMLAHPTADADDVRKAAGNLLKRGYRERAARTYEMLLKRKPDDMEARRTLRRLRGQPEPGADFARFRRDGDEAMAAFAIGDREASAPATALIHQRLVEVFADGSMLMETHELRRLNDPQGVEVYSDPSAPAEATEVSLLRTIDRAGEEFVPVKVQDNYSMPRLEPGAFVEWRYQDVYSASDDGEVYIGDYLFRSAREHRLISELVVIRPRDRKITVRSRNFEGEPEVIDLGDGREARRYLVRDSLRLTPERSMPPMGQLVPVVGSGADGSAVATLRVNGNTLRNITRPTPPIRKQVAELLTGIEDAEAQLNALHDFCHEKIAPARSRSATETLMRKRGNRQQLLLAMLHTAGFQLEAGLCESIRADLIQGDAALFPDPERHYDLWCIRVRKDALAPLWLFFDTPRYYPPGAIPAQRARGGVLVLTDDGLEVTRLPASAEHMQTMKIEASGRLTAESLEVDAVLTLAGLEGYRAAEHFLQQPRNAQKQFARRFAQQMFTGWQLRSADVVELEPGKPVAVKATLRRRSLQADGERQLLAMPLPPGRFLGAFGARPGREIPMRLTTDLHLAWDLRLELDGVHITALPATVAMEFAGLTYLQEVQRDGAALRIRRRATMTSAQLPTSVFGDWMQALQVVERAENLSLEFTVQDD